jgi:hypothetical protein
MEETLEGGRGPPWAVAPLDRERGRGERERETKMSYFKFGMCIKLRLMQCRDANSHSGNISQENGWRIK